MARREKLLPLDRGAVARVVERAARLTGDADRLFAGLREIVDLLQEADQLAARAFAAQAAEMARNSALIQAGT